MPRKSVEKYIEKLAYIKMCYLSQIRILKYVDDYLRFGHLKTVLNPSFQ